MQVGTRAGLGKKPLPPIAYEQREMCVGQIVAQECYYSYVPLYLTK
jgi:hypothetical protein